MEEQLRAYLVRQWPDADEIDIREFAVIAGGYSRETYRFDARVRRGDTWTTHEFILRKDPPPASAILGSDRSLEHQVITAVRANTTIPAPRSHFVEMDAATFGTAAMVIERAPGSCEPSALFNGGPHAHQAEAIATQLCEMMAALHTTDPKLLNPDGRLDDPRGEDIDPSSWDRYMESTFAYYLRAYDGMAFDPLPVFRDGFLTLRRQRPRPLPLVVVHGDFNPANFLYQEGHVTALIDWENCHVGDPREDLGWLRLMDTLSNTNIFGSVTADGGFLGHYNKLTGFGVTEEEVNYFQLFMAGNIGIPVVSAVKRRIDREHLELMHLYITQPVLVSEFTFSSLLQYPMPQPEAS
jgi:aminoglycoside phosphotransferase (APT) family kinase protein